MRTLKQIDTDISKFAGFSKGSQNSLDINAFADIYENVQEEVYEAKEDKIIYFFFQYFDFDLKKATPDELDTKLNELGLLYTKRSKIINDELTQITALKKELSVFIDEIVFQSFEWQTSFWSFFYHHKILKNAQSIHTLSQKMDTLNQSYQRRIRWSMDLVIGDYYVIYLMHLYLFTYINEYGHQEYEQTVKKHLMALLDMVSNAQKSYPLKDAKIIHRYIILELSLLK